MLSNARRNPLAPRVVLLLAAGIALSACGATIGKLPEKLGGLPEAAPQHPAETMPFPNVYEPRPKREAKPLSDEEQKKLESELSNLRDSQNLRANPPPPPPKAAAKAGAKVAKADGRIDPKAVKDAKPAKAAKPVAKSDTKSGTKAAEAPAKKKKQDDVVPDRTEPAAPLKPIN